MFCETHIGFARGLFSQLPGGGLWILIKVQLLLLFLFLPSLLHRLASSRCCGVLRMLWNVLGRETRMLWATPGPEPHQLRAWTRTPHRTSRAPDAVPGPNTKSSGCRGPRLDPNSCQREYEIECQTENQSLCHIDCQIGCQNRCQIECQNVCLKGCQNKCQKECGNRCQKDCQDKCQKVCQNR